MVSETSRANQLESGVRIGDFEIEKRLGAGGMGIVYQARQVSLNRRVALKVLGPALDNNTGVARFQREAQAVARLKHPGIASLYFIGQDSELCYHVMELVDGVSLRRVIERLAATERPESTPDTAVSAEGASPPSALPVRFDLPTTEADSAPPPTDSALLSPAAKQMRSNPQYIRRCVEIVLDVARALSYAHKEGVIHRDIKPENLMLDPDGEVHVIDFGLARFFDDVSLTYTGQLVGTPLYMSPEQVTGRIKLDQRTDIYSLGMVLYELLTLRPPIESTSRENLLRNIVARALPPLSARNRSLSRELEAVVHKATHKDPEERYQTAADFAEDLQRYLDGKPVTAPPYRYRLDPRETVGNRPGVVVLSAFFCFLAGGGGAVAVLSVSLMTFFMLTEWGAIGVPLVQVLLAGAGLAVSVLLGNGLLAGRNWARWVVVVLASCIVLLCLAGGASMAVYVSGLSKASNTAENTQPDEANVVAGQQKTPAFQPRNFLLGMVAMYSVPLVVVLICGATSVVSLLLPSTAAWFHQAERTRHDHRVLLHSLGD